MPTDKEGGYPGGQRRRRGEAGEKEEEEEDERKRLRGRRSEEEEESERAREQEREEGRGRARAQVKLSENDGTGGGEVERRGGQPMQILPEQRANQGGRQPLQRSGLPLVTGRGAAREGTERRKRRSQEGPK